jgi:hypothetical protein
MYLINGSVGRLVCAIYMGSRQQRGARAPASPYTGSGQDAATGGGVGVPPGSLPGSSVAALKAGGTCPVAHWVALGGRGDGGMGAGSRLSSTPRAQRACPHARGGLDDVHLAVFVCPCWGMHISPVWFVSLPCMEHALPVVAVFEAKYQCTHAAAAAGLEERAAADTHPVW